MCRGRSAPPGTLPNTHLFFSLPPKQTQTFLTPPIRGSWARICSWFDPIPCWHGRAGTHQMCQQRATQRRQQSGGSRAAAERRQRRAAEWRRRRQQAVLGVQARWWLCARRRARTCRPRDGRCALSALVFARTQLEAQTAACTLSLVVASGSLACGSACAAAGARDLARRAARRALSGGAGNELDMHIARLPARAAPAAPACDAAPVQRITGKQCERGGDRRAQTERRAGWQTNGRQKEGRGRAAGRGAGVSPSRAAGQGRVTSVHAQKA